MFIKRKTHAASTDRVTVLEQTNREIAYRAAVEGIVLLENRGVLPITPGKVALYGAGAGMTIKGGTGSGEVNERHAVSILEGMEEAGFTVTTKPWIEAYARLYAAGEEAYAKEFRKRLLRADIVNLMQNPYQYPFGQQIGAEDIKNSDTDTCIYVVARQAGEGADRRLDNGDYSLSDAEKENLRICAEHYSKMIVVINVGCSFDMSFIDGLDGVGAVVFIGQLGTMGGKAFADVIRGKVTPSGKLTDTWAKEYTDFPCAEEYSYLNGNVAEEYYKEGIYVGYRYFDTFKKAPRYPFGYGLSYTTFDIRPREVVIQNGKIRVSAQVTNTGDTYSGKEVVQLYVSCPQRKLMKEYQKLAAFTKTKTLEPGESELAVLEFGLEELASYDEEEFAMILEEGQYVLRLGNSSRNTAVCAKVLLDETVETEKCENICERRTAVDEIFPPENPGAAGLKPENAAERQRTTAAGAAVQGTTAAGAEGQRTTVAGAAVQIFLYGTDFVTDIHTYQKPSAKISGEASELLDSLSLKEAAELTVGAGMKTNRLYFETPGAAGNTTGALLEKGIPNVTLADGPAGLRLQKRATVTKKGEIKPVDPVISLMSYLPDFARKFMLGDPEKDPVIYQFTTAFPVGLCIAQTWNIHLAEEVGKAVGEEMKTYGVTYWLAPALNIHRNPLCGRNFEYYSEDPLISGKIAAAVTRGVQKWKGCYVTLKHFCCNNQEDNRNYTNANVSERALREIYLRGFAIAVREGKPGAVMSSYNKVNGTYVNNSYDLLTKVLRNEWGFDGIVMTDWFATGKKTGNHALAIKAGNDLIMPGGANAVREILRAVKDGQIREADVRWCAANVLGGIVSSRTYELYGKEKKVL